MYFDKRFISKFFSLTRSMRQGCPLAAYLYILQAEPLAQAIRKSLKINGIKLPTFNGQSFEARISLFADDTQLFHSTEESIIESFKILDTYCKASGAKLNFKKTKGLYIGSWKNKKPKYNKIQWVKNVCGLGTHFGYEINYEELWMQKFTKFKSKIASWSQRDLTLEGKKLIINSYILSSMSYLIDVYTENIPQNFIKETKELIRDFLWQGKTWRISQTSLALKREHGGIELPELENFVKCKKVKWLVKIYFSKVSVWNCIGKHYIHVLDGKSGVVNFLLKCTSIKGLNIDIPKFYLACLNAWFILQSKKDFLEKREILNQNIFGNQNISCKNKPLFMFNWTKSNIVKINDIWDENINDWTQSETLFEVLSDRRNFILEYNKIKLSIPREWKYLLRNAQTEQDRQLLYNPRAVMIDCDGILINGKNINYTKLKQKDIYFACLYPIKAPTCLESWNNILNEQYTIVDIFKKVNRKIIDRKALNFHFMVIHRAIYSEKRLQKMNKSDGICKVCKSSDENLCHLLYDCIQIKECWYKIFHMLTKITDTICENNVKTIVFGITHTLDIAKPVADVCNLVIIYTKYMIWLHRNNVKYQNEKVKAAHELYKYIMCKLNGYVKLLISSNKINKLNVKTTDLLMKIQSYRI